MSEIKKVNIPSFQTKYGAPTAGFQTKYGAPTSFQTKYGAPTINTFGSETDEVDLDNYEPVHHPGGNTPSRPVRLNGRHSKGNVAGSTSASRGNTASKPLKIHKIDTKFNFEAIKKHHFSNGGNTSGNVPKGF